MRILFLFAMIFGSQSGFCQLNFERHSDRNLGIALSYPKNWKPNYKNPNRSVSFTAMRLENDRPAASLWIHVSEDKKESLDTLTFNYMKLSQKNGNKISGGKEANFGGRLYYFFTTSQKNQEDETRSQFYTTKSGDKFYIVCFMGYRADYYAKYEPDFLKIIESLKID
ncbi:hypothetical protein [Flavobacterium sp.]|uniref:hypothetical protein n=1 Tax=Flavobacterium sp. TaxID=239 RepID=UPI00121E67DE|nr:hypothetical protein [Flavobacterium sp.]RZJ72947.1 MAG: hypothetical protein EOO49_04770 [Flavobacterium sp.]